jgi:prefoldin subunit 5
MNEIKERRENIEAALDALDRAIDDLRQTIIRINNIENFIRETQNPAESDLEQRRRLDGGMKNEA